MKKDAVLIGTVSVIIITLTLSLLNIYVFPDLYFKFDIYRNTDNPIKRDILLQTEVIGVNSSFFDGLNRTAYKDFMDYAIVNISRMITLAEERKSAAYDMDTSILLKRNKLIYNGTIIGVTPNSTIYKNWIEEIYEESSNINYFGYTNETYDFNISSNFEELGTAPFDFESIFNAIDDIFNDTNRDITYIIFQSVSYSENRGFLSDYSTDFQRLIFTNSHGDVIFFLSNEGVWVEPSLF